ncbi:hypothetical protein L1887_41796 [Cichorium endivia]|nr:hypothetical protein L1887_41796 [Cichorium endivia]
MYESVPKTVLSLDRWWTSGVLVFLSVVFSVMNDSLMFSFYWVELIRQFWRWHVQNGRFVCWQLWVMSIFSAQKVLIEGNLRRIRCHKEFKA